MVKVSPPVKAECYLDVSDWQILEIIFKIVLFSVLIYVSYKLVKFVMSYVNINNLAEIQIILVFLQHCCWIRLTYIYNL